MLSVPGDLGWVSYTNPRKLAPAAPGNSTRALRAQSICRQCICVPSVSLTLTSWGFLKARPGWLVGVFILCLFLLSLLHWLCCFPSPTSWIPDFLNTHGSEIALEPILEARIWTKPLTLVCPSHTVILAESTKKWSEVLERRLEAW